MNNVILIFALILGAFALSTWATIWSRRETRVRVVAVLGFLVVLAGLGPASMEGLGFHRPMWAAWRLGEQGELLVLSFKLVRHKGIYLYVDAGSGEPRAIVLPWSDEEAAKIQKAQRESWERGDKKGRVILKFDQSPDVNERRFHPMPVPALPIPKPAPDTNVRTYERGA